MIGNKTRSRRLRFATASLVPLLCLQASSGHGRDLDKKDNLSPEIHQWVLDLKNGNGVACCATADGWKPELVEWDTTKKGYKVMIENKWVEVPDNAVIRGPNKLGHAEVWYYHVDGLPVVRCFLPGAEM